MSQRYPANSHPTQAVDLARSFAYGSDADKAHICVVLADGVKWVVVLSTNETFVSEMCWFLVMCDLLVTYVTDKRILYNMLKNI